MKSIKIALFFILVSQAACFTTGRDFPSKMEWIAVDRTTQEDVMMVLGSPFAVGNSNGVTTWSYGFYKYSFGSTVYKELKFYWNTNKTVKNYSFTSSFPEDIYQSKAESVKKSTFLNGHAPSKRKI